MVLRSVADIFDVFMKYGIDKVLLQVKTNGKGKVSYCLRASLIQGFPMEIDPKIAEEFAKAVKRQDYFLKGFSLEPTLGQDPERKFFKMVRVEFGHEEAHHALTGD